MIVLNSGLICRHAGVYTRAEAVRLSELKLIKLQGLYRDQITHLQHVLKQRRRSYLQDIRRERETYCNLQNLLAIHIDIHINNCRQHSRPAQGDAARAQTV